MDELREKIKKVLEDNQKNSIDLTTDEIMKEIDKFFEDLEEENGI